MEMQKQAKIHYFSRLFGDFWNLQWRKRDPRSTKLEKIILVNILCPQQSKQLCFIEVFPVFLCLRDKFWLKILSLEKVQKGKS
jgi:hypothetical protein